MKKNKKKKADGLYALKALVELNAQWRPLIEILKVVYDPNWGWAYNDTCKYINLRIDMRDKHALVFDRDDNPITVAKLAHQRESEHFKADREKRKFDLQLILKGNVPADQYPVDHFLKDLCTPELKYVYVEGENNGSGI